MTERDFLTAILTAFFAEKNLWINTEKEQGVPVEGWNLINGKIVLERGDHSEEVVPLEDVTDFDEV